MHNSENLPLVSVLIPTKNRPHFFEHALKSALNQTYTNIEIIVFDESDNNETEKAIQPYLCQFPSIIRYIKQQAQDGNKNNFHFLYELSSGEFINFLMDDDLFHPEKIKKMMNYYMMDENQEIRIVTSHRQLINEHGDNLPELPVTRKVFVEDTVLNGISFGNMVIKKSFNCIGEPTTVLFRKQDLNDPFGVFNGRKYGCNVDLATWMNLLSDGKIVYISETLSYFRIHEGKHLYSIEKIIQGAADYGHSILTSPKKGFLQNNDEYREAVQSCISYITMTLESYKHISLNNHDYQEAKTYLLLLEQLNTTLKHENCDRNTGKICFTILAHDHEEVLKIQLENVRRFNPNSFIVLYNGGTNKQFGQNLDVPVCPYSEPLQYGNLTRYFYDTMRWLEELHIEYEYLVNLDNDVLFVKKGFEQFVDESMLGYDCMGPHMHFQHSIHDCPNFVPGLYMWKEWHKWQPVFKTDYFGRYFNPGQVYNRRIIRKMLAFEDLEQVVNLWVDSDVFALEEMFWITFAMINGGKPREYPWNFDESLHFVRHIPQISEEEVKSACQNPNYFWVHPIKGDNLTKIDSFLKELC